MRFLQVPNDSPEIWVFLVTISEFPLPSIRKMDQGDDIACQVAGERVYILMEASGTMYDGDFVLE